MQKLFSYPGGKWPIRNVVVAAFPKHTTYVDVFGGSAAILLTKEKSEGEVFNDKNERITNFFRVVKHRPAELAEGAQHWIHSRTLWTELRSTVPGSDEIDRALHFWILLQDSFGARGANFGTSRVGIHSVTHARKYLDQVAQRLEGVHVECLDFAKCIRTYDSPGTFFYCDPPYPDTRRGDTNYDLLSEDEWRSLLKTLSSIKGKFLLSCNNSTFVLNLFRRFRVKTIKAPVTLSRKKGMPPRTEILISNYALPRALMAHTARPLGDRGLAPEARTTMSFARSRRK